MSVSCASGLYFGSHHLAVVRTPANCLIFTDGGGGNVYSFKIAPNSGMLSTSPASSVSVGGNLSGDLAVSGSTVFESNPSNFTINVLTAGSGCALTLQSQNSTGLELDPNIALAKPTTVVSADVRSGDMVAYMLQPSNTLVETVKDHGQLGNPQSVAVPNDGTHVYTGQAIIGPPHNQGFSFDGSAFTPLPGSPQTSSDSSSSDGAAVAGSSSNHLLAQADQFSNQIGWYSLAGGGMSYTGDTPLTGSGSFPSELTIAGDNLFVAESSGGDVEDCALAHNSVSNCHTVATTTGGNVGGSVAIFK